MHKDSVPEVPACEGEPACAHKVEVEFTAAGVAAWNLEQLDAIAKSTDSDEAHDRIATLRFVQEVAKAHYESANARPAFTVTIEERFAGTGGPGSKKMNLTTSKDQSVTQKSDAEPEFTWPRDMVSKQASTDELW